MIAAHRCADDTGVSCKQQRCPRAAPGLSRRNSPALGEFPDPQGADHGLHVARPPLSARRARALHVEGDARVSPRQAPPRLRQQRQQCAQGYRVGGQAARGDRQGLARQEPGRVQQCRPALQPPPLLEMDEEGRRRRQDSRQAARLRSTRISAAIDKAKEDFIAAGVDAVRFGLVLDRREGRQARDRQDAERRKPAGQGRLADPRLSMCGSTPTISIIATAARTISRRSGRA